MYTLYPMFGQRRSGFFVDHGPRSAQVSGDLEMLRKFHYLETLNLRGTKLTGNLDVIPCFGIREVSSVQKIDYFERSPPWHLNQLMI